jgi:transcription elongation factor Elf1
MEFKMDKKIQKMECNHCYSKALSIIYKTDKTIAYYVCENCGAKHEREALNG